MYCTIVDKNNYDELMEEIEKNSYIKWGNMDKPTNTSLIYRYEFVYINCNNKLNAKNVNNVRGDFTALSNKEFCDLCEKKYPKKLAFTKENVRKLIHNYGILDCDLLSLDEFFDIFE
jgi:hypothetical protein